MLLRNVTATQLNFSEILVVRKERGEVRYNCRIVEIYPVNPKGFDVWTFPVSVLEETEKLSEVFIFLEADSAEGQVLET